MPKQNKPQKPAPNPEQALYQAVYGLLSDVLPAYAVQW